MPRMLKAPPDSSGLNALSDNTIKENNTFAVELAFLSWSLFRTHLLKKVFLMFKNLMKVNRASLAVAFYTRPCADLCA
ncbi:hypothetical protein EBU02_07025 [bacterium]|jgi:hypothetical protein|nr:hypothetical protein [bacterium]NBS51757.1 hypothetical protein [Spartobacteria bacterium]